MTADALLARLAAVKQTGTGRWIAICPAHDDGRASLSIRELEDGRVLLHCFAECSVDDVLTAVNLDFDALYPPRAIDHCVRRERDPFNARDVLKALADEALVVAVAAASMFAGHSLTEEDRARLCRAATRIDNACDLFRAHPAQGHRDYVAREELDEVAYAA